MQPFSPHNRFFSSLDQLQLRLSSEQQTQNKKRKQIHHPAPSLSSSPLFLSDHQPPPITTTTSSSSSGPPLDFLSDSPITNNQQHQEQEQQQQQQEESDADDIEALMGLLGLPITSSPSSSPRPSSCDCSESGFYKRIAGAKGPKCDKEMKRLDGWIDVYRRERREPARLAHLLIAKAVAMSDSGDVLHGVEFPATVEEFLERDPVS